MISEIPSKPTYNTIVIQGGSRGIGLALAQHYLQNRPSAVVFVTGRTVNSSDRLELLREQFDGRLKSVRMDLAEALSVSSGCGEIVSRLASIDLLVNCSGIVHDASQGLLPEKRLEDVNHQSMLRSYQIHTVGPAMVASALTRRLLQSANPTIVNISARVGSISDNSLGGWFSYRCSKAAQNMLTKNMSIDLRRRHKRSVVIGIHPGTVDTALSRPYQKNVKHRIFSPNEAAAYLANVISVLEPEDTGKFFAWDGKEIPW